MNKSKYLQLFVILIFSIQAPSLLTAKTLDHKIFLKEIENSSDKIYLECLEKYDDYLNKFPQDVMVHIEKCKFIQFAQYDEYDEYNPNQEAFDSCATHLVELFPEHPEVLLFQTTYLWGEELEEVFKNAEKSIDSNPEIWSKENLGKIYFEIANNYYWDSENKLAYSYIQKAIHNDKQYATSLEYAQILIDLDQKNKALEVLVAGEDTTTDAWVLTQKADLYLQLEAYQEALELYKLIDEIDSTYNNNQELANTLEGVGEYDYARTYLIKDTNQYWDKEEALKKLLAHDLKYQDGETCVITYNQYRDYGYRVDPLGIYRLKLFIRHPLQKWKFRDILGLLTLAAVFFILIVIPSVWILPVYFIGHKWKFLEKNGSIDQLWGLKAFWFVSSGYLLASWLASMSVPDYLYSLIDSSNYALEISQKEEGKIALIFILIFSFIGLSTLFKKKTTILLSSNWPAIKSIYIGIGLLIIYKIIISIYIRIGVSTLNVDLSDVAIFLSSKQRIQAIIANYGNLTALFLVCILAPIYEEIIFRGVILNSCEKYINFKVANAMQAALFATIHLNLFLFPVYFLFGIITGILRKKSGGLLSGIIFHMVNNILALSFLLLRN